MPTFFRKNLPFITGAIMLVLSLVFSTFSVVKVLSAPLAVSATVTVPTTVGFEGFLADSNGNAFQPSNPITLTFKVWDNPTADSGLRWSETQPNVQVTNGLYSVQLGSVTGFSADTFSGNRWIGVTANITGTAVEMSPRTKIGSVPFALNAEHANSAETVGGLSAVTTGGQDSHLVASDANGSVTVSGGLNVGGASGATSGQLLASDRVSQLLPLAPTGVYSAAGAVWGSTIDKDATILRWSICVYVYAPNSGGN